ncbi:GNAT family N-acetyltransferase [Fontibacillus sp. BL9]|uniref:GNAT family N-acetyltransferase n=1 Tax=Fontibacillus sp. BL9 TaxID=3389971 RepID=UPI00397E658C
MVELRAMDDSEFKEYRARTVHDYAVEKTVAGTWSEEEANALSEQAISQLLPEGLATKDAFLYTVLDAAEGVPIGNLWVQYSESKKGREAFIFDIVIHEPYQGKGFGKQTLQALDEEARKQGTVSIGLHVFGHNRRAYGLYQKMGYETTDMVMRKKL